MVFGYTARVAGGMGSRLWHMSKIKLQKREIARAAFQIFFGEKYPCNLTCITFIGIGLLSLWGVKGFGGGGVISDVWVGLGFERGGLINGTC